MRHHSKRNAGWRQGDGVGPLPRMVGSRPPKRDRALEGIADRRLGYWDQELQPRKPRKVYQRKSKPKKAKNPHYVAPDIVPKGTVVEHDVARHKHQGWT